MKMPEGITLTDWYKYKPYESFDKYQLPFGDNMSNTGIPYSDFEHATMDTVNCIRRNSAPVTKDDILRRPIYSGKDIRQFLLDNIDRVREISEKTKIRYRSSEDNFCGINFSDGFGLTDVFCYFRYDRTLMRYTPKIYIGCLNRNIPEQRRLYNTIDIDVDICTKYDDSVESQVKLFELLLDLRVFKDFEFIPVLFDDHNYIRVSHNQYKDEYGHHPKEYFPVYGINIMKDKDTMSRLKDWQDQGGIVKARNRYLILTNREDRSKYYLKRVDK